MDAMTRAVVHGQAGELATAMVGIENDGQQWVQVDSSSIVSRCLRLYSKTEMMEEDAQNE